MLEELKVHAITIVRDKQKALVRDIIRNVVTSGVDDINDALLSTLKTVGVTNVAHESRGDHHAIHVTGTVGDVYYEFSMVATEDGEVKDLEVGEITLDISCFSNAV